MIELFIQMFSQVEVPEASAQAMNYYQSGNFLWIIHWVWTLVIPLLLLVSGLSGKLGALATRWGKNWFISILIYLVFFIGLYQLLNLPIDFYVNYIREHDYGLSNQSFGRWLDQYGKMTLVFFLSVATFIWVFYLLLKKSPKRWWFYSSLVSIGITFIMAFIYPIWIVPLFNKVGPLKDKQLEKSILELASRAGIENGRVFEVDKSKDTKMGNAYVAGLGGSQQIVIWDTSIKANSKEGLLFIMGHEMGHYVLHHVWLQIGFFSVLFFIITYLIHKIAHFLLPRYHERFGFQHLYEIASLPLFLFLVNFFYLLSTPIYFCLTRYTEREADRFGIEITQNNKVAAQLFADAVGEHLANPRPGNLYKICRSSHPSLGDRVDFCNSYCPWEVGQPLKYGEYFKEEENGLSK